MIYLILQWSHLRPLVAPLLNDAYEKNSPYIKNIVNIKSLKYLPNSNSGDIFYQKEEKNKMENIHNKFIQEKNKGVTVKELCSHFNISKSTAYNWIKLYSPIKRLETVEKWFFHLCYL